MILFETKGKIVGFLTSTKDSETLLKIQEPVYPACTITVLLILFGPFEVEALVKFRFQYSTVLR